MKYRARKKQSGVTLIELLFVTGVFGVVLTAVYSLYAVHQRNAYIQDEAVEVQQNLRTGMDSITRDIRMAGFLVPSVPDNLTKMPPIQPANNASGTMQPDNITSDEVTLNTASASSTFARITPIDNAESFSVTAPMFSITVDSPESVDSFNVNDYVRIVRPQDRSEPRLLDEAPATGRVYQVTGTNRNGPSLTLAVETGSNDPTNIILLKGDMICKTASPYPNPNTIRYCLGPKAGCGSGATCPTGQLCLMRSVNNASTDVIAQNMAGLQFRYLMDDGMEVDQPAPEEYRNIRAVRTTLTGRTMATRAFSGYQAKVRQIGSLVQIRNR